MKIRPTELSGVVILEPQVFEDERGMFMETFQRRRFTAEGLPSEFVQHNYSSSLRYTLRGLHYQIEQPQGKLVRVVRGETFDVAVDLRRSSGDFGKWVGVRLSEDNHWQLYIPPGFAHGFCVTSEIAGVLYGCTDFYAPQHERSILWSDPDLAIDWPVQEPLLSAKDRAGLSFREAPCFK